LKVHMERLNVLMGHILVEVGAEYGGNLPRRIGAPWYWRVVQMRESPIPEIVSKAVQNGGCPAAVSAAPTTSGAA